MGGKEGSRGYIYQGAVAVLEALTQDGWDKIFIEFPTKEDKVDIALSKDGDVVHAIQVKSTDNTFSQGQLKQWVQDIAKDYPCKQYELVLIGQCAGTARTFINSIVKYMNKQLDTVATAALADFDTYIFDRASVTIRVLPNDLDSLQANARDCLSKFLANKEPPLTYHQRDFIVKAMLTDQLLKSTQGGFTERFSFDAELEKRIKMMASKYTPERIPICIQSFTRGAENVAEKVSYLLDLRDKFDDRKIKQGLNWNNDLLSSIERFLVDSTDQEKAYKIYLEVHSSIAFLAGRILDTKSGIDIFPIQKTSTGGQLLWDLNVHDEPLYHNWQVDDIRITNDSFDTALIINATHNIKGDVDRFIENQNLPICRIINCTLGDCGATNYSIKDGAHTMQLANEIYAALAGRTTPERRAPLHIFAAAPNAFMFFLGKMSRGFGKCILYEYDFEQRDTCSYLPSIDFTK